MVYRTLYKPGWPSAYLFNFILLFPPSSYACYACAFPLFVPRVHSGLLEGEMSMHNVVWVGFVEKVSDPELLMSPFFPSKVDVSQLWSENSRPKRNII